MHLAAMVVLSLLLLPGLAVAQQLREVLPRALETTITTSSEYTDNFFRSESRPQSNFRQTVSPDLTLTLSGPLHRASLRYRPTAAYSTLVEELEAFHLFDAAASYEATPFLTVSATDQFLKSDDPAFTDPNALQVRRTTTTRNLAGLELPYRTETWSVTPRGSWLTSFTEREAPLADEWSRVLTLGVDGAVKLLPFNTAVRAGADATRARFRLADDFSGQTYRGGVSRQVGPRLELSLDGSLALRQPDRGEDFMIREVTAGGRYASSEALQLSARLGYQQTDVTERPGNQGLTYSGQLSYTGPTFTLTATSDLSIQESFTQAENVGVVRSQGFGATLTYRATEDLLISGAGRWSRNEFLESSDEREDTVLTWTLSTSYRATRTVTVSGAWERTDRNSTRVGAGFSANTVRLDLSIKLR